jgi:hypothetical protein
MCDSCAGKRTCEVGLKKYPLLARDMPRWKRHGGASSLSTMNVRATFRVGRQMSIAPLETPVTEDLPDHQVAEQSTTSRPCWSQPRGIAAPESSCDVKYLDTGVQMVVRVRWGVLRVVDNLRCRAWPRICSLRPR